VARPRRSRRTAGPKGPGARGCALAAAALGVWALAAGAARADTIDVEGMTFVSGDASGRHLVVRADRARIDPRSEVAQLERVEVHVRDADPAVDWTLRCQTARIELRTEGFRLDGDVRGVDAEGRRFSTAWLEYDPVADALRTTSPVTVVDGPAEYRGGALEYDVAARRLRLLNGATVVRSAP
jgi:LPS export ABC transporter protein LptC